MRRRCILLSCLFALGACASEPAPAPQAPVAPREKKLVAMRVESDTFPKTAELVTDYLRRAIVHGYESELSKVSLEIVQLSIECTDPTVECYEKVGRTVQADALLLGDIQPGASEGELVVQVSLFGVADKQWIRRAAKKFPTEDDAAYEVKAIVNEVTKR